MSVVRNYRTCGFLTGLLTLMIAGGCATGALGSLFAVGSLFSLVPGPQGPAGQDGTNGTNGTNGVDGSLRIYGDGSLGDVTVNGFVTLFDLVPTRNVQFRNLTIGPNGFLEVPSGAVIRCSETFVNNGELSVDFAERDFDDETLPGAGISHQQANNGKFTPVGSDANGGSAGAGVSEGEATFILTSDPRGGGAGGSSGSNVPLNGGGSGGGRVIVLAKTSITNAGGIDAKGEIAGEGGGGGGGGIIVLASAGSITNTNTGILVAFGGDGGDADNPENIAGGGGGGGGIVHLLAPTIANNGTININHGAGGSAAGGSPGFHAGGGGGGACGGHGGHGGTAEADPSFALQAGFDGDDGYSLQTIGDPTSLF